MPVTRTSDGPASALRRLGPVRLVTLTTAVVLVVFAAYAVIDLRTLDADRPAQAPVAAPADQASGEARGEEVTKQVAVKVTISGTGPFSATVTDRDKKKRTFTSNGEDVVLTRVFDGPGPYLFAGAQLSIDATLRCRIDIDGKKAFDDSRSGLYAQVYCAA